MKKIAAVVVLLLLLSVMAGSAMATEAGEHPEEYAGEYAYYCVYASPEYLDNIFDQFDVELNYTEDLCINTAGMEDEYITLDADGTGYLYWGESNQGPIDWWTMEGEALQFQAGVAVIDGTIKDGIMTVELGDGSSMCLAAPGAELPADEPMELMDCFKLLYGIAPFEASMVDLSKYAGEYTLFAYETEGYIIEAEAGGLEGHVLLSESGWEVTLNEQKAGSDMWTAGRKRLGLYTDNENLWRVATVTDGVIMVDMMTGYYLYFANEDADISGYDVLSEEAFLEKYAQDHPEEYVENLLETFFINSAGD